MSYLIGEKRIVDDEVRYYPGGTQQGMVYKDSQAYDNNEGICYISEYGFEINDEPKEYLTEEQAKENGYTRSNLEAIALEILGDKKYALDIFDTVDWQYPETYALECVESLTEEQQ